MGADLLAMLPELLLLLGALCALVAGSYSPQHAQWRVRWAAAVAVLGSLVAAVVGLAGEPGTAFEGTVALDTATGVARVTVALALLLLLALAGDEVAGHPRESEIVTLLLLAGLGTLLLASATDLALLVVAFLLSSIPLYGLVGIVRRPGSAEATLKTYLLGALFGITLMLGVAVLFGLAGGTAYDDLSGLADASPAAVTAGGLFVLGGLLFKAGAVPAHFWVPDATQGASVTAAGFLTTVPKLGALVAVARLLTHLPDPAGWTVLLGVLAVASMTVGNLAALAQDDVRRLLGWSTVSQVGYLLAAAAVVPSSDLALPALLVYLPAYTVTNLAAFAALGAEPDRHSVTDWAGVGRTRPGVVGGLAVSLLGLVGTPPTAVFVAKLLTIAATWDAGAWWLAVALVGNTLISLAYYLRWLAPAVRREQPSATETDGTRHTAARVAVAAAAGALVLGLAAGPLWLVVTG
ncbi:NADH-quinone oxidoreductase subunit N [Nocardioides sp. MJB4]|uniref:NADH-quinone oxidoreductase subunit N n=2 Tax=Nocardioides donggukensis TaxID=2774019 RepID=A0A927K9T8_9ACTN|nr:NADH-quinone oxidoreductase subunit N [Nocardioides donggukensis]